MSNYATNVTMLNDLPDLDEIDYPQPLQQGAIRNVIKGTGDEQFMPGILPPGTDQYKKFIRGQHMAPQEAGMAYNNPPAYMQQQQQYMDPQGQEIQAPYKPLEQTPTCLDFASHVAQCPICSKFYKNDNTMYIIAIIVLAIVCILLLKRVLDV